MDASYCLSFHRRFKFNLSSLRQPVKDKTECFIRSVAIRTGMALSEGWWCEVIHHVVVAIRIGMALSEGSRCEVIHHVVVAIRIGMALSD